MKRLPSGPKRTAPTSRQSTKKRKKIIKKGIDVKDAQKTFIGLSADTSSDEEMIPPTIASAYGPLAKDLVDPQINSWIKESEAAESSSTAIRVYNPAADPWRFDEDYDADEARYHEQN